MLPDWEEQLTAWHAAEVMQQPGLRDGGLLMIGPTGPHVFGQMQRGLAAVLNSVLFTIDLDPRWVKKLIARGAANETAAYVEHIIEQAGHILRSQHVTLIVTTPPLLQVQVGGAHLDEDTRAVLRDIFPNGVPHNAFGSNMIPGAVPTRQPLQENDPVIFDARSPYITFLVIDPQTGRPVGYGERARS